MSHVWFPSLRFCAPAEYTTHPRDVTEEVEPQYESCSIPFGHQGTWTTLPKQLKKEVGQSNRDSNHLILSRYQPRDTPFVRYETKRLSTKKDFVNGGRRRLGEDGTVSHVTLTPPSFVQICDGLFWSWISETVSTDDSRDDVEQPVRSTCKSHFVRPTKISFLGTSGNRLVIIAVMAVVVVVTVVVVEVTSLVCK